MIDEEIRVKAGRRFRRRLWMTCALMVLATLAGAALAVAQDDDRNVRDYLVVTGLALGVALIGVAIGLLVVYVTRRRGGPLSLPSPLYGVDRQTRRRIAKAVRTGQHLQGQEEELAIETADRMTRARWIAWLFPVVAVVQALTFVTGSHHGPLRPLTPAIWIVLGIAVPISKTVNVRRGRAYLAG